MTSEIVEHDLNEARREGHQAGLDEDTFAINCPYGHRSLAARMAWLDGFSAGRIESMKAAPSLLKAGAKSSAVTVP